MLNGTARTGTIVWVILCILTLFSVYFGEHHALFGSLAEQALPATLLAIAMFKVRLIIMYFMEIASSPLPLRVAFELWIVSVFVLLLAMFTMAVR